MANTYNKTIIIGRLGQDPEFKTGGKTDVTRFSLSNNTVHKDGTSEVQWHKICAFGKQAVICHQHLKKGDLCCIEGRLDTRSYEKDGEKRISHAVIAERITFLSTKRRAEIPVVDQDVLNQNEEAIPF
ncbi:MAG: single-stranded DNA-binding protein [Proteobacteria bacterium]|jgi:single-strand DNA-binding protein|nr:single-stranded DNA-binding protein [Pseudomonadota bacterium]